MVVLTSTFIILPFIIKLVQFARDERFRDEQRREREADREEKRKRFARKEFEWKAQRDRERKRDEKESKERDKLDAEMERARLTQLKNSQEWDKKMRQRDEGEKKEREKLDAEVERARHALLLHNQEWEKKMRLREEMDDKRWAQLEKERQREKRVQKERDAKAQQDREQDAQRHLEELEMERRDRKISEKKRDMEFEYLKKTIHVGIKLFYELFRRQQQSRGRACTIMDLESDETQIFEELFVALELPQENGDFAKDVVSMFNGSLLLLEDNPDKSLNIAQSSQSTKYGNELALIELPERNSVGFEDDILQSVLKAMNIDFSATLFPGEASSTKFYGDFERSMMITPIDDGTRTKQEGNAFLEEKNFCEAIKCYSKSIDKSQTAEAYSNRAMAYIMINKFIEAEKDCTAALRIDASYFEAYARRATARSQLGSNLKGALNDTEVALELNPNCLDMKQLRAELREMLG